MVCSDIWMGSGATVSMIPEQDINLGTFASIAAASGNQRVITLNSTFITNFSLVDNLYRGCYLCIYKASDDVLTDRVLIQGNAATTLTVNDSLASAITTTATDYYGVIEQYGAPVPAPKQGSGSTDYDDQVLTITFKSDNSADYDDFAIVFGTIDADGSGGTQTTRVLTMSEGATYGGSLSSTSNVDISGADLNTAEEIVAHIVATASITDAVLTRNGANLVITNDYGHTMTYTPGLDNGTGADVDNLVAPATSIISLVVTTAGATVSSGGNPRLLSDTWLGLATSVGIPSTTVDTQQMNLVAGGTRNHIYQYKGIETTDNGSLELTANTFWPLYYALGKKSITTPASAETAETPTDDFTLSGSPTGTGFIYSESEDTIHRTEGTIICPPLAATSTLASHLLINNDDVENDFITYTITEENGHQLPSFALEYTLKKADQTATVGVDSAKENVYTKIYPGTVINSLTMSADSTGPVNMSLNLAHKNTFVVDPDTNYQTLNGQTDVKDFVNYRGRQGQTETLTSDSDADTEPLMRPFFFADGTISMFGQDYIRLASFTLTIDNQLQPQRYIGRYDKNSQVQLTGQRTYQLQFTGHVTDAAVFNELQSQLATALSTADSEIVLRFTKENGEELTMKFRDYMVTSASFPVNNDRGPIVVDWTIQPLTMQECAHTTYWAIQG